MILKLLFIKMFVILFIISKKFNLVYAVEEKCDGKEMNKNDILNSMRYTFGSNLQWPSQKIKSDYIKCGKYNQANIIYTRAQMCAGKTIVLSPKYRPGVPYTIGEINLSSANKCNAPIKPYPCWELHNECSCDSIINAVDLYLDSKGILWVLDTGVVNTIECPEKICGPKVIGFQCETGQIVTYNQLYSLVMPKSRLQYLTVDYDRYDDAYIYVSDAGSRAILVWDVKNNRGYRVVLPKSIMVGEGNRDVLYLALIRMETGNKLYFTYLSGDKLYFVKTSTLQQHSTTGTIIEVGDKPGKIVILGTDNGSVLFFRLHGESDIYMWNTDRYFKTSNFILAQKGEDCRLATHVFPGNNKFMWGLETNFQDFLNNKIGCLGASTNLHPLLKPVA